MEIIVLGLSGSIGTQTLEIIDNSTTQSLLGFSFWNNIEFALKVISNHPNLKYVCTKNENIAILKQKFPHITYFNDICKLSAIKCDLVVVATVGFSALKPTLSAVKAKNDIALANKECIVAGGKLLFEQIKQHNVQVFALDSELNAIEQCLKNENKKNISKLILTASGGPFLNTPMEELNKVTLNEVVAHPNWNMGLKISIDSANLCNKVLEVIESAYYFDVDFKQIEIVIQPTSMVHSMVQFCDNSIIMQMSKPSMLLPISYGINKNKRKKIPNYESVDFNKLNELHFITPKREKYPILEVLDLFDKNKPYLFIAFNALNEYFNFLFQQGQIKFVQIAQLIIENIKLLEQMDVNNLEDVFSIHKKIIKQMEQKYEYDFTNY